MIQLTKKFNPDIHQAVSKVHNEKVDGTIVEEMQKGFKIGDRLLRPAMVVVSMGPEIKKNSRNSILLKSMCKIYSPLFCGDSVY